MKGVKTFSLSGMDPESALGEVGRQLSRRAVEDAMITLAKVGNRWHAMVSHPSDDVKPFCLCGQFPDVLARTVPGEHDDYCPLSVRQGRPEG